MCKGKQQVFIGTSGYSYGHWKGTFYPDNMKGEQMLPFYASKFSSVEINSTFYHMPRSATVEKWLDCSPDDFVFSLKAPKTITHIKRLSDVEEVVNRFYEAASVLAHKLGVVLYQLPPSLKKDLTLLEGFLKLLDRKPGKKAVELRHVSWVGDDVFELLKQHNVAFVVSHGDNYPLVTTPTADFMYVRLHGYPELYRSSYSVDELQTWANLIRTWLEQDKMVYVYFNNDAEGHAVKNALALKSLI